MKEIIVKSQTELDKIKVGADVFIKIEGGTYLERIVVKNSYTYRIEARGNSNVVAWENSNVVAWGNSNVEARENSNVVAWGNSNVVAWENSNVVARGNSNVVAWGNSNVEARENSNVVARENSNVEAWENSNVEAWGNSNVVAWGNSNVVAWENSNVEAWGNSNVVARGNVGVHLQSDFATVALFAFSVCWKLAEGKIKKMSKTVSVIEPKYKKGVDGWLEKEGIEKGKEIILYKRVSKDFKTQEGSKNETLWSVGILVDHPAWIPEKEECGEGKFHACSRPYFCDEFRSNPTDVYIAIAVSPKDMYAWENPTYPHKIAFRKGTVMYQCNKVGKKIEA